VDWVTDELGVSVTEEVNEVVGDSECVPEKEIVGVIEIDAVAVSETELVDDAVKETEAVAETVLVDEMDID
jgi:hypothetical protein